ncbi:MAG: HAMP domain-containing protein [Proteobacteria bacterium]|nr:HAMP domain-containing protein [Pseudomonadota bacterium]MBU1687251.1 HAMP domain-containing protein [Pseudomonadota bacterium]
MTIKFKTIIFSSSALIVLIVSIIIFYGYRSTNHRFNQTLSTLDMVNQTTREIAINILLDLTDVESLQKYLKAIPAITLQLQQISPNTNKPAELINLELSFVRIKRVVDNLTPGRPIPNPTIEQIRNEIRKISTNSTNLKTIYEREINALQSRAEISITLLIILLIIYIIGMFTLLIKMVIQPLLTLSSHVEHVRAGEQYTITPLASNDEIGQLSKEFKRLIDTIRLAKEKLKQEVIEHKQALEKVKLLSGFLPICTSCKKIRDDRGYWNQIETYIRDNSEAEFTHGYCPDCADKIYADFRKK